MVVNIDKFIDASEAGTLAGGFAVAPVSWSPEIVVDISGPTTSITLPASQIAAHSHADATTSGLKFEFTVPENYDAGPLLLQAVYSMSTSVATPNNQIVLSVGAELADATGGSVDTATYTPGNVSLTTPDNTTDVARSSTLLTIMEGDFTAGDKIVFLVERLGANGADLHTGAWQLIDYLVVFDGQVAPNVATHQVEVYSNTGGTPAAAGTKSSFDTLDFQEGFAHEQKFQFTIPDNWDGSSDFHVRFTYAMTSAGGGNVRFNFSGEATSVNTGAITALVPQAFIAGTFADTDPHRTTTAFSITGQGRTRGDTLVVIFNRPSSDPADTHTGDFQLLGTSVTTGQGGSTAVVTDIDEFYLADPFYRIVSGTVTGELEAPDYATDFELWTLLASTSAVARIDAEWHGKLRTSQTKITSISIPVKGQNGGPTPQYQVKVYVEGSGATPIYTGVLTPETTGVRSLITLSEGDLGAQPTGEKRYFVVVEATLDSGEELRVGSPFVRQE